MISENLKKIYQNIHRDTPFGKRGKFPKHLEKFIKDKKPQSILDFGCGKGKLVGKIKETYPDIDVRGYDPANSEFDGSIDDVRVDMIISSDVLEHVEPEYIDDTLKFLQTKSKFFYHLIACSPAKLILPDGRNAHLIVENDQWWRQRFIDLGYKIVKEDFLEFTKILKGRNKPMLVRKYFIMGETNGQS
jgi:cyclopropane fatty-acyl-phospholipid synthase-like methyltransferase